MGCRSRRRWANGAHRFGVRRGWRRARRRGIGWTCARLSTCRDGEGQPPTAYPIGILDARNPRAELHWARSLLPRSPNDSPLDDGLRRHGQGERRCGRFHLPRHLPRARGSDTRAPGACVIHASPSFAQRPSADEMPDPVRLAARFTHGTFVGGTDGPRRGQSRSRWLGWAARRPRPMSRIRPRAGSGASPRRSAPRRSGSRPQATRAASRCARTGR